MENKNLSPTALAADRVVVKASIVAEVLKILGPRRERDAEWLAERIATQFDNLRAAGSGVLPVEDIRVLDLGQLADYMREHSAAVVQQAFQSCLFVALDALKVGLSGQPKTRH